ncbi:restriction endonuclease subunit S, partial [Pseudomonas aeruginosa]|nr:restriction endonuclease subunit S [Pseudomonas aeruginosa]
MTALLTDNLPLLAGAPNGTKKLRELILELAVRGKLVPQDPNDEPASELLKRIAEEKARLVSEGKVRKQKPLAEIGAEEKPFDVPTNWEWVRVAAVGHDWGQKTPDKAFTYIDVGAVDNAAGRISAPQVLMAEDAPSRARKVVRPGTVIYSTIRPYLLNVAVIEEAYEQEPIASTAFAIIHPYLEMPARYFLCYLRSPVFVRYVESVQMGIAYPAINDGQFFSGLIPLPPLAEQHRIVAKVDELMALCDRLEARQADADSAHAQLVQALLGSLTQASDAADFAQSWQRLAEHFHTLFTTESSIDALKQTLLQLAVMGKLVPQDPNDEPASELLKRIADAKEQAASQGRVRKVKTATDYRASDTEVTVPAGWSLSTVGEVTICRDGERIPVSQAEREGRAKTYDYYGASGVIDKIDGYLFDKPLLLVGEDGANLINRSTPIAFMARGKYWVNNHAHVLDGVSEALLLYVQLYFNAIDLKPYVTGTAQPKMNQAKM